MRVGSNLVIVLFLVVCLCAGSVLGQACNSTLSCNGCLHAGANCGYCLQSEQCMAAAPGTNTTAPNACTNPVYGPSPVWSQNARDCFCDQYTDCFDCAFDNRCGWCYYTAPSGNVTGQCLSLSQRLNCPLAGWTDYYALCPAGPPKPPGPPPPDHNAVCNAWSGDRQCHQCLAAVIPGTTQSANCKWCYRSQECAYVISPDCNAIDEGTDIAQFCPPPAVVALIDILVLSIGGAALFVLTAYVVYGSQTAIDERFGRGKVMLFDEAQAQVLTRAKVVRYITVRHPLLSIWYCAERDPYGSLARLKWALSAWSALLGVTFASALSSNVGFLPSYFGLVLGLVTGAWQELNLKVAIMCYRREIRCDCCPAGCRVSEEGIYDACCLGKNCTSGRACGVMTNSWDWIQIGMGLVSFAYQIYQVSAQPLIYVPGVMASWWAGIIQSYVVAILSSAFLFACFPASSTRDLNAYLKRYGGTAANGSDVIGPHGEKLLETNAGGDTSSSSSSAYVPPVVPIAPVQVNVIKSGQNDTAPAAATAVTDAANTTAEPNTTFVTGGDAPVIA